MYKEYQHETASEQSVIPISHQKPIVLACHDFIAEWLALLGVVSTLAVGVAVLGMCTEEEGEE